MKASKITILYALIPHLTINSVIPQIESFFFFFGLFVLSRERSNAKIERGKEIEVSMSLMF